MAGKHRSSGRAWVLVVAIGIVVIGAVGLAAARLSDRRASPEPAASASEGPTLAHVLAEFPDPALGRRITLTVRMMRSTEGCTFHTMNQVGTYWSDCETVDVDGVFANIFWVQIRNESEEPIHLQLDAFSLETPEGEILAPLPVGPNAPGEWLQTGRTMVPRVSIDGYVAFPGRDLIPGWLTYLDEGQRVTIHIPGPHRIPST